jgi:enoyl-CoA hydratase/carnithine racemase
METVIDNQFFTASTQDTLAIINFKNNIFDLITNIDESQILTEFIRSTEYDNTIKGLLVVNEPMCLGEKVYDTFIEGITHEMDESSLEHGVRFSEKNVRFREINILNKFIKFLVNYKKLYVAGLSCTMVTPFMGVVLVADLRFATPNLNFKFSHKKYGLHPSGGLPFFLDHYLGHSKAVEVLLSDGMDAEEAMKLGLINRMLPAENFVENCVSLTNKLLEAPASTLRATKRLINFNKNVVEDYFEYEASLLNL